MCAPRAHTLILVYYSSNDTIRCHATKRYKFMIESIVRKLRVSVVDKSTGVMIVHHNRVCRIIDPHSEGNVYLHQFLDEIQDLSRFQDELTVLIELSFLDSDKQCVSIQDLFGTDTQIK